MAAGNPGQSRRGATAFLAVLAIGVGTAIVVTDDGDSSESASGEVFLVAEDDPGPDAYATDLTVSAPSTTEAPATTAPAATTTSAKGQVVVEGARKLKKAMRKSAQHPDGGLIEIDGPLHISNVKKLG